MYGECEQNRSTSDEAKEWRSGEGGRTRSEDLQRGGGAERVRAPPTARGGQLAAQARQAHEAHDRVARKVHGRQRDAEHVDDVVHAPKRESAAVHELSSSALLQMLSI